MRLIGVLAIITALGCAALAAAQQVPPARPVFSAVQAQRGGGHFATHCAACHTATQAAALMLERGADMSLEAYHTRLASLMPPQSTVKPDAQGHLDIMAYLLRTAGTAPGPVDARYADTSWRNAPMPIASVALAPSGPGSLPWAAWRGDNKGQAYSSASLIDRTNVGRLRLAWHWTGANQGPSPEMRNITTPLMVDGVLYATAGLTRNVVALDAATGETLWMWRPEEPPARFENAPRKGAGRGVSYWSDGKSARILTVTPGFYLVALDAKTGRPVPSFGDKGGIDLMKGLRNAPKEGLPDIGSQSPPLVIGDTIVVGAAHLISFRPRTAANVKGDVRAFDARTGRQLWTFRTIPQKGDPAYGTWEKNSAEPAGNGGVWAPMSADAGTGAIFMAVESGTSDLYGGARPGANAHTSSLVSLDAKTGKLRWAQQLVHHDIWDWDVPAIPILADLRQGGATRKSVLQITKQGFVFAFDRNTGEPLWPIEERPVPASDVPGEVAFATQPHPTRPLAFDRQGFGPGDVIDFTPVIKAEAMNIVKPYRFTELYTPPSLNNAADGTKGILRLPHALGGGNWEGGAFDPETGMLYVASMTQVQVTALAPAPPGSAIAYQFGGGPGLSVRGLPIVKPPWGRITAIDMTTGDHTWMIANANTPKAIAEHPDLKGLAIPRTGIASRAGLLATKTLLFAGEGEGGSPIFRAHDKATGEIVAEIALPASQTGLPMTYVWKGKQYIAMAVGDGKTPAGIVALSVGE